MERLLARRRSVERTENDTLLVMGSVGGIETIAH